MEKLEKHLNRKSWNIYSSKYPVELKKKTARIAIEYQFLCVSIHFAYLSKQ